MNQDDVSLAAISHCERLAGSDGDGLDRRQPPAGLVEAIDEIFAAGAEIGDDRVAVRPDALVDMGDALMQRIGAVLARAR